MSRKILCAVFVLLGLSFVSMAQDGANNAYSPYSVYGIGDLYTQGNSFTRTMGGVGTATRNHRYINFVNPASITARDTLSFMCDFGIVQNNQVFKQGNVKSANNTFNIADFLISFPIWRSSAMAVGITPFSDVGYDFSSIETDKNIIGRTNTISYDSYGSGGLYQAFIGAGATFWKRLSIGAEMMFVFGTIDKVTNTVFTESSYRSINGGYQMQIRGFLGKFGLQYEQPLGGNVSMIIGATYRPSSKMRGYLQDYSYAITSEVTDTLRNNIDTLRNSNHLRFGSEKSIGITIRSGDRWCVEFDYTRSDWRKSGFDNVYGMKTVGNGTEFTANVAQSFRAGFEYVPNRNDIRYYHKRIAYRAGLYHEQTYYMMDGNRVTASGITFGVTLPVFRYYNGISIGMDIGHRGTTRNNMVGEHYAAILVGFNLHDLWFQKPRYN